MKWELKLDGFGPYRHLVFDQECKFLEKMKFHFKVKMKVEKDSDDECCDWQLSGLAPCIWVFDQQCNFQIKLYAFSVKKMQNQICKRKAMDMKVGIEN